MRLVDHRHLKGYAWRRYERDSILPYATPYGDPTNLWNKKLADLYPGGTPIHPDTAMLMGRVLDGKGSTPQRNYLGSDATQSTMPIYEVDSNTPLQDVRVWATWRYGNDSSIDGSYQVQQDIKVPIPANVMVPGYSDYQVVLYNIDTGDEWNFWHCGMNSDDSGMPGLDANSFWQPYDVGGGVMRYTCESAGLYRSLGSDGTPGVGGWIGGKGLPAKSPKAWGSRGAKVPYGIGLVRKWEIEQGHIDHAIAWAYHGPSPDYVSPAQNSDGVKFGGVSQSTNPTAYDIPEGGRIRLDPNFDLTQFPAGTARVVGKALQDYGAILIDNSGYPKIYMEYKFTAGWNDVTANMLSVAPLSAYQVIDWSV